MRKYLILIVSLSFLININTNAEESPKGIYQNFSGGLGTAINFPFFECYLGSEKTVLPVLFFEFTFKFDYLFLKTINDKYKIGFGLSIGDSINVGGLNFSGFYLIYNLAPYTFFNKIGQKLTLVNVVGNDDRKKYAIFETGLILSLVNFYATYNSGDNYYYTTCFMSPYLFIGFWGVSEQNKNLSHIIGGFAECNFDLLKNDKNIYSSMKAVYCYLSFGIEYRIGYRVEK
ncbi:MAG TPA: hypothetical protein PK771_05525 [Spirochaetota bacterium]|nr:hypothetical protein [Spirochaetota bacterium]